MTTNSKTERQASDIIQDELKALHLIPKMSWRKIACMPKYQGIPAGTLCSISKGGQIPNKYRAQLGIPHEAPAPVCLDHGVVHLYDCKKEQVKPKRVGRPRQWRSLWDIPETELLWMLENRS